MSKTIFSRVFLFLTTLIISFSLALVSPVLAVEKSMTQKTKQIGLDIKDGKEVAVSNSVGSFQDQLILAKDEDATAEDKKAKKKKAKSKKKGKADKKKKMTSKKDKEKPDEVNTPAPL